MTSFDYNYHNPSRLVFVKLWIRRIAQTFLATLTERSNYENCLLELLDRIKRQQGSSNVNFGVSLARPVSRFLCERKCWLRVILSLLFYRLANFRLLRSNWGWKAISHTLHFVMRFKKLFCFDLSVIFWGKKFMTNNNRSIKTTVVDVFVITLICAVHSKVLSRAIEKIQFLDCYFWQIQTLAENHLFLI